MSITNWPKNERPREKLLTYGASNLSDAELLAISIRTGVKGKTAVDLAREAINQFGSLRALLQADKNNFCKTRGLGIAKYVQLQAVLEMGKRHFKENITHRKILHGSADTGEYIRCCLADYQQEVFACLFLNSKHRVICFEELFYGSVDNTLVHPREVVKRALRYNAAALILAHNHPSGCAEPSEADKEVTLKLKDALALIDVRVLDHIIVGDGIITSLAARGLLHGS
jgi:DNA repair protein RadC